MRLAIITNGNFSIGFGHISRTLVLASQFLEAEIVFFISKETTFTDRIKEKGYKTVILESFLEKDCKPILDYKPNAILIDSIEEDYDSLNWLSKFKHLFLIVTITLFFFDKWKRFEHLSFFPSMEESDRLKFESKFGPIEIYTGSKFFTFRDEFNLVSKKSEEDNNIVTITMGGGDPYGLTYLVVDAILDISTQILIILSEISPCYSKVKSMIEGKSNFKLITKTDNIALLFSESDMVILNGGLTRYEVCATRTPFIAISIHDKQYYITEQLTRLGVGVNVGVYNKINKIQIKEAVEELLENVEARKDMANKMKSLFDTFGAKRIKDLINDRLNSKTYEKAY